MSGTRLPVKAGFIDKIEGTLLKYANSFLGAFNTMTADMSEEITGTLKIETKVGEAFKIRLWEDRTKGGCRWVPTFDAGFLRLLNDEYERTRNIRVSDIGMRYFEFIAISPGVTEISLESRYGWKFSADKHMTYEVSIAD